MSLNGAVVEVRGLSFSYGRSRVLDGVDFDIHSEDFVGLVGPNGGGKTTLIKLILGLLEPEAGQIRVFEDTPRHARRHVGYVAQHVQFDAGFPVTVREMVLTGRLGCVGLGRRYRREDRQAVERMLDVLELAPLSGRSLHALSGGERQRVMVARALVSEPKLLILDEPTASVDSRIERNFYDLLRSLNARIPIVLVSHDLGFISSYVTRVACLNRRLIINEVNDLRARDVAELYDGPVRMWSHDCEL